MSKLEPPRWITIKSEPEIGPVGPSVTDVALEAARIATERSLRGPKAGGKAQSDRAEPNKEKLRAEYRRFSSSYRGPPRGRKAAFYRHWKRQGGPPQYGERQLYSILSAEP